MSPIEGLSADEYAEVAEFMIAVDVDPPHAGEYVHVAQARLMLAAVRHFRATPTGDTDHD